MIEVRDLTFRYPNGRLILQDFNWQVARGEAWAILGPSGCGKSTLLYLLAGLRRPTSGKICIEGQEITRPRPRTGLILQDYGLLPWFTARQNVSLGLEIHGFYGPDGKHAPVGAVTHGASGRVAGWMERLGIEDVADQFPGQLSGGQRQRVAIARTLALQPDLLLMDEPFSSLDANTREGLQQLVLDLSRQEELTLVAVTHAIEEAAFLGHRILLLGAPPISRPEVVENLAAGAAGYRSSPAYERLCRDLRDRMRER